jgi:hypothetical protein
MRDPTPSLKGIDMRKSTVALICAGLWLASAAPAWAKVTVTFTKPESYSDMPWSAIDRDRLLQDLQEYLIKLGGKLPADRDLKLEILDIDLAGRLEPGRHRANDIRIMRGSADWPRMDVRYTLESNGKVIEQGEDHLSDMGYLMEINRHESGDSLRYEKTMIDDWFKKKFLKTK